jgi:hypothetical protein
MSTYLTVTKEVVAEFFNALLVVNGETTTLDVKRLLRDRGYFATQTHTSALVVEIAEENGVEYTDNNTFRVYHRTTNFVPSIGKITPSSDHDFKYRSPQLDVCQKCGTSKVASDHFGWSCNNSVTCSNDCVSTSITNIPTSDLQNYVVTSPNGYYSKTYFGVSRGAAKNQWVHDVGRSMGYRFFDARTMKFE